MQHLHKQTAKARTSSLGCIWEREGKHYLTGLNAPLLFPPPEKLPRVKISQEINSHSLVLTMFKGDDAHILAWLGGQGTATQLQPYLCYHERYFQKGFLYFFGFMNT